MVISGRVWCWFVHHLSYMKQHPAHGPACMRTTLKSNTRHVACCETQPKHEQQQYTFYRIIWGKFCYRGCWAITESSMMITTNHEASPQHIHTYVCCIHTLMKVLVEFILEIDRAYTIFSTCCLTPNKIWFGTPIFSYMQWGGEIPGIRPCRFDDRVEPEALYRTFRNTPDTIIVCGFKSTPNTPSRVLFLGKTYVQGSRGVSWLVMGSIHTRKVSDTTIYTATYWISIHFITKIDTTCRRVTQSTLLPLWP